jgi:TM2 domain-containing membrane protein YozV
MAGYPPGGGPYGYGPPPPMPQQQYPQQQYPQQQYPQYGNFPPQGVPQGMGMVPYAHFGVDPETGIPYSEKQKLAAGLLQIFLGKFGVGRFYTGHTGLAIAQLCTCVAGIWILSWFTCGATIAVILWPIIDGIVILSTKSTDSDGRILR